MLEISPLPPLPRQTWASNRRCGGKVLGSTAPLLSQRASMAASCNGIFKVEGGCSVL